MNFIGRFMAGVSAFRQAYVSAGDDAAKFESVEARRVRYLLFFAFYENTAYSDVHKWAQSFRSDEHLYKYIRGIYNPSRRLCEFYKAHLLAGSLDFKDPTQGAIPIETDNPAILPYIADIWRDSNMQSLKDVVALRGAIEGDVFLAVADDLTRGKVSVQWINPYTVSDVSFDGAGNIKGYVIEETRQHPEGKRDVQYKLEVTRDGQNVVYRTYLNNAPYGWYGQPSMWAEPYGFVPMVHIKHNDVGLEYGWSEIYPLRGKVQEVDEQASMLSDYLRKYHDPLWLLPGGRRALNLTIDDGDASTTDPQPGRDKIRTLTGYPEGTKAQALVTDMKVADTLAHIASMQEELERDCPELKDDIWSVGDTSGRALRIARQRVEANVYQRRANYDNGIVRIQQMALSIGGFRGYFPGIGLESYERGQLDHMVADRAVFQQDPMDQAEIDEKEWEVINSIVKAGASLEGALESRGWPQDKIRVLLNTGDGQAQNTEGDNDGL